MTYEQLKQICLQVMEDRVGNDLGESFFEWLLPVEFKEEYERKLAESDEFFLYVMKVIG